MYDFPNSPTVGQTVSGPGGAQYQWDGNKWILNTGTIAGFAPINSPHFAGVPTAPTAATGDASNQLATDAFVHNAITAAGPGQWTAGICSIVGAGLSLSSGTLIATGTGTTAGVSSFNSRIGAVTLSTSDVTTALPPSATNPLQAGTATPGFANTWARGDHVHPVDTSRLAVAGGTITGNLIVNGYISSTTIGATNVYTLNAPGPQWAWFVDGTNNRIEQFDAGTYNSYNPVSGLRVWGWADLFQMSLDSGGNLTIATQGYKPGGGSWAATSDERIKDIAGAYKSACEAVCALRPVMYRYKGNDHTPDNKELASSHARAASDKTVFYGLSAQHTETVMPELVKKSIGYIDGERVDDLRHVDTTPLIMALVNCIRELDERLRRFEGDVSAT